MDRFIKGAWVLNGITFIAAICMVLFKCWPLHRQWQIYPDPGSKYYMLELKNDYTDIKRHMLSRRIQITSHLHHDDQHFHRYLLDVDTSAGMFAQWFLLSSN